VELYDYQARFYDHQIGRWGVIDPHSENYHSFTGYVYVGNNPTLVLPKYP
jgi:RHS repeat-associated protein